MILSFLQQKMESSSSALVASLSLHSLSAPPIVDIDEGGEFVRYMKLSLKGCSAKDVRTNEPMYIYAQTDVSGSMSDKCTDGRSKIQHVIHIWSNIIRYFAGRGDLNVNLQMNGFDSEIHPIFPMTRVTRDNYAQLVAAVESMHPMKTTNIELALQDLCEDLSVGAVDSFDMCIEGAAEKKTFALLMTDGDATDGSRNPEHLATILPEGTKAAFIGFGKEHNAELLNALGMSGVNTSNWLVNNIEYSSDVYAEILAKWTTEVAGSVVLRIENGYFYEWKTSVWGSELNLGSMSMDEKRDIHVKSLTPYDVSIQILADGVCVDILKFDSEKVAVVDLTQDMFRLCVQKIMHEVKEFGRMDSDARAKKRSRGLFNFPMQDSQDDTVVPCYQPEERAKSPYALKKETYEKRLKLLLKDMQDYVAGVGASDFMNTLIHDIEITINQFGKPTQFMYLSARTASQGRQQTQTVDVEWDDDDVQSLDTSRRINQAYASPAVLSLMRDISTRDVDFDTESDSDEISQ
jgi:hypothetical protein